VLSGGAGAFALYQFDRTAGPPSATVSPPIAASSTTGHTRRRTPNTDFHKLFAHFVHQVTLFGATSIRRRERAYDRASARSLSCAAPALICATI
jgi:hypothetical protein